MILIDYKDKRPIYEQVVDKIQNLILNGVLEPNSKLPSVRNLAVDLSVNPNTIQRAYVELERQGFIYVVKGRGNFVSDNEKLHLKEREKVMDDLVTQINRCRQAGIDVKEVHALVTSLYMEEE